MVGQRHPVVALLEISSLKLSGRRKARKGSLKTVSGCLCRIIKPVSGYPSRI